MITLNPHIAAFKASLYGVAMSPFGIENAVQKTALQSVEGGTNQLSTTNLSQSVDTYLHREIPTKTFNSSFLNSTSITSQEATERFVEHLQKITDFGLQHPNALRIGNTHFGNAAISYQSFNHSTAYNYLQESLLTIADAMDRDSHTFTDLRASAHIVLQSFGMPVTDDSAAAMIRGISQLFTTQLNNIGHLVDLKV